MLTHCCPWMRSIPPRSRPAPCPASSPWVSARPAGGPPGRHPDPRSWAGAERRRGRLRPTVDAHRAASGPPGSARCPGPWLSARPLAGLMAVTMAARSWAGAGRRRGRPWRSAAPPRSRRASAQHPARGPSARPVDGPPGRRHDLGTGPKQAAAGAAKAAHGCAPRRPGAVGPPARPPARGSLPGLLGLLVGFLAVGSGTKTIKEWSG